MSDKKIPALLLISLMILILLSPPEIQIDPTPEDARTVADLPIPSYPVCPTGSDCATIRACAPEHQQVTLNHTQVWSTTGENRMFSSPHTADLTGDGVADVIVGTGIEEQETGSVVALNGADGTIIWEVFTPQEMFGSAQFADLNLDGTLDVLLGGRGHHLVAVNGLDGSLIWSFDSDANQQRGDWYQFYTGHFIVDQNGDDIPDWLTSNGGDPSKAPGQPRDTGYMMVISGATGDVLGVADTPDGMETYMSPILYQPHPDMEWEVLYGTGGETWHGSLWSTSIADIMAGDISNSVQLIAPVQGVEKGVMAPPAIVDINLDGIDDVVASTFDGRIVAIDGRNYSHIWNLDVKDYAQGGGVEDAESWASPAIGYFTDDAIPDVLTHYVIGAFPDYSASVTVLIDGSDGTVISSWDTEHTSFTSPLAVDLDSDGRDEVLMLRSAGAFASNEGTFSFFNVAEILDTCTGETFELYNQSYLSIGTPTIVDLDSDGDLELITTATTGYFVDPPTWEIQRFDLNVSSPQHLTWAAYMGTNYDGVVVGG